MKVTGWPVITLLRGKVICRELELVGGHGGGAAPALRGAESIGFPAGTGRRTAGGRGGPPPPSM